MALQQYEEEEPTDLFATGCSGGDYGSCHNLGLAYLNGAGVPRDPQKAVELLQKACDGDAPNCTNWAGEPLVSAVLLPKWLQNVDKSSRGCSSLPGSAVQ